MSNRTLIIILAVVAAFVGWFLFLRPRRTVAVNGVYTPPATVLPPIPPPIGSIGSGGGVSFAQGAGQVVGAAAQAACAAKGGGPLCGFAGAIAGKSVQLQVQVAQKVGGAVVSGAKSVGSGAKKLLGKLF